MSLYLCFLALGICYLAARRSLVTGLVALLSVGYVYGIARANIPDAYSHFIFDCGVLGFYGAQLFRRLTPVQEERVQSLRPWLEFLIMWPVVIFLVPIQDMLVQLVGLRGNIFLLPLILIGARLAPNEKYNLALWLAVLNAIVLVVAAVEFVVGIEGFFPRTEVTKLIYLSKDVVGHSSYRIPSTFATAHAYAGTMVMSLPLLCGAFFHIKKRAFDKSLLVVGVIASIVGVLMAATRLHFVAACLVLVVGIFSIRSRVAYLIGWTIILCGIGWIIAGEQRFQRFTELQDTQMISERVAGSVNMNFLELAAAYPFGNGMGGGGTSLPYFLSDRVVNPIFMENEYARIMLEQGIPGLLLWVAFAGWVLCRRNRDRSDMWFIGRRIAWATCVAYLAIGLIGTGMLTAIPQTCLLMLSIGWVGSRQEATVMREVTAQPQSIGNYSIRLTS
jgi:hypothetical protein